VDCARARIRSYRPADLEDLYRICLLTGNDGQDATSLFHDPKLLGHVFAAPYGLFEPSLAFVAEDTEGVGGYILGALDTQAFQERLEGRWWPDLRTRYPDPSPGLPSEQWTPDQQVAHMIRHALPVTSAHRPAATPAGQRIRPPADQDAARGPARPGVPGRALARPRRQPERGWVLPVPRLHRAPRHPSRAPGFPRAPFCHGPPDHALAPAR
jgi:hypothetical protein